jgi:hypothetical protein
MKRMLAGLMLAVVLGFLVTLPVPAAEPVQGVSRTYSAPVDRVWSVTEAVLRQLGWDVDKADRSIGWITTDSRKVDFEDYGVYAKGTRHRLRLIVKEAGAGQSTVTVERTLFTRERILFVDNDTPLPPTGDHAVEESILAAIAKGL